MKLRVLGLAICLAIVTLITPDGRFTAEVRAQTTTPTSRPAQPFSQLTETTGPIAARSPAVSNAATSGQGYWRFVADKSVLPLPEEIKDKITPAHGTLIVDRQRDIVYWGLQGVGWVKFTDRLTKSEVVKGDEMFTSGNIHGAELIQRPGQLPLVIATDNLENEVYLSDTSFQNGKKLEWPQGKAPYANKPDFKPTDATFVQNDRAYVTDGYGRAFFMPVKTDPFGYDGNLLGGKPMSNTPHGITYDPEDQGLYIAARPEGIIKKWYPARQEFGDAFSLPTGSTVCDVELWGDYALAPCLDGGLAPQRGQPRPPGPIYILNMKKNAIVATIKPKDDLGFDQALHIHDATWYIAGEGNERELYILFTNWNPGGIGAMKLVAQ